MKKLTILLTVFTLLLLLCACKDRTEASEATTEPPAVQATEGTTVSTTQPNTGETEADAAPTEPDTSFASTPEESSNAGEHALIDSGIGDLIIVDPTEPTIGLPTPVEPPLEVEDVELPPDDFE